MGRRDQWRRILDLQMEQWKAKSYEQLATELRGLRAYEIEVGAKTYQVEVELLEHTDDYVRVMVAVDDGSFPASVSPAASTFIRHKGADLGNH